MMDKIDIIITANKKNMKVYKYVSVCIAIAFCFSLQAQNVGINSTGATPRNCAMLDILSSTTGLLIPNLSLTATGTYAPATGTAVDGLLVYNTNSGITGTGSARTGYYYWSTSASLWINLVDNLAYDSPWFLIGNTGITNPAIPGTYGTSTIASTENWMGSTDSKDVVLGTNQIERMRIMNTSGRIGIGTALPNSLLDVIGSSSSRVSTGTNNGAGDVYRAYSTGATIAAGYAGLFADVYPSGAGSGYGILTANCATQSQVANSAGTLPQYSFGVFGNVFTTSGSPTRVGGVIGAGIYANQWTSLGYVSNAGTISSLYYNSTNTFNSGGGRISSSNSNSPLSGIGIVGNSDAFGIVTNGGKGGMFVYGEKIGLFTDGTAYTNNISVQLNKVNESSKLPTFSSTSTSVDIQSHGQAKLVRGHVRVNFDEVFIATTSEKIPVNITITAIGKSNGLYIESVDTKGFDVYENNNGLSAVSLNWLAIGVKKGFEAPELNADVLKTDFETNMRQVANNEGDPNSTGKPLWWDGTSFRFDIAPPEGIRPHAAKKESEPKHIQNNKVEK